LLRKYDSLSENLIHLSFNPWNLKELRDYQIKNWHSLIRTEQLVDRRIVRSIIKPWEKSTDLLSYGISAEVSEGADITSEKINRIKKVSAHFSSSRNAVDEEWLREDVIKTGYTGVYTINSQKETDDLLSRVSPEFLKDYGSSLYITSDNPKLLIKQKH